MEHLLFAAYLILFSWLVTKTRFFTNAGLSPAQLVILFLVKVMAGIFYGWIGVYYGQLAKMVDTWAYHYESIKELQVLFNDPAGFFTSLFHNSYEGGYTNFLSSHNSWWNDLKANIFIKLMSIFNLVSFQNYYTNIIFYAYLTLFGPIAFYRVMKDVFPAQKLAVLLSCFLIPSFIYWTSGLHKEGLIFLGLALIVYHIYFGMKTTTWSFHRLAVIIIGFILVLVLRIFVILPLVPAVIAWLLAKNLRWRPVFSYLLVYGITLLFFFNGPYFHPKFNLPAAVSNKQQDFLELGGNSAVGVQKLEPNFLGFVTNAPEAFINSTVRPYPADVQHLLSLAAAVEINFLLLLFLIFIFFRRKEKAPAPLMWFCIAFGFSVLMTIGYSVNVLGAIVRYRSIILPFLVVPMVAKIDWNKLGGLIAGVIYYKK